MAVRLTNLPAFIEIPGRRRTLDRGRFDQLNCTLVGPQAQRDRWVPAMESRHPEYPLMLVTNVTDIEQEGALVTLSVTYQGRMYINGFQPTPVLTISSTETSASVQVGATQLINVGKSTVIGYLINGKFSQNANFTWVNFGGQTPLQMQPVYASVGRTMRYGWATITINYISYSVTAKYQTLTRPTGPIGYSQGCYVQVISTIVGEVSGTDVTIDADGKSAGNVKSGGGPDRGGLSAPSPRLTCTNFSAQQVAGSFYDCSETWELKYIEASHVA